jgi:hypothetical protein
VFFAEEETRYVRTYCIYCSIFMPFSVFTLPCHRTVNISSPKGLCCSIIDHLIRFIYLAIMDQSIKCKFLMVALQALKNSVDVVIWSFGENHCFYVSLTEV